MTTRQMTPLQLQAARGGFHPAPRIHLQTRVQARWHRQCLTPFMHRLQRACALALRLMPRLQTLLLPSLRPQVCKHACMHVHLYVWMYGYMQIRVCVCVCVCVFVCVSSLNNEVKSAVFGKTCV